MKQIKPSHVAILVPSVRKAANFLRKFDFQIGEEEKWDGEGTLEIYIERDKANSLLLMEPTKPGAYQFVDHIDLKMEPNLAGLLNPIGLDSIIRQASHGTTLSLNGNSLKLEELF